MITRSTFLKGIAFLILLGIAAGVYLLPTGSANGSEGVSPLRVSTTATAPKYALHVLFIGNSFTFVNDIPGKVIAIASSDPGNETQFTVQSVTRGGIDLKILWDEGKALEAIRANHWDYVVLQEQSAWAMAEHFVHQTHSYVKAFDAAIRQSGARTLLYLTWVNKPGSHWYTDKDFSYTVSPDYMYKRFAANTKELAEKIGATTVPVGTYWQLALTQAPEIELYQPDGHHQGPAGAYLAALVFYKTLTGRDVTAIPYRPDGMDAATADKIKRIVSQAGR